MPRGRPRKLDPSIPAFIDQERIPRGIYWDATGAGRWYALTIEGDGKRRRETVAGPKARLSDLHAIAERRSGNASRGSVTYLLQRFHDSTDFNGLAPRTRADYTRYQTILTSLPTRTGAKFGDLEVDRLSPPVIQRLVESIAGKGHPTKANHLLRYLRRTCRWGVNHGVCRHNPAAGVQEAKVVTDVRVPDVATFTKVTAFARERGALMARTRGSCAPYLWMCMDLAYLCRLRGIEVITLTDAHITATGVVTNRRKGSRDVIVQWSPRLREVVDAAQALRAATWEKYRRPVPMRPEQRTLVVAENGTPLTKSGLDTAWQRLMKQAVEAGLLTADNRFGLHAMKHRGITDTAGGKAEKQEAGGHKSARMTDVYDHELAIVPTPEPREFSGEFSGEADSGSEGRA